MSDKNIGGNAREKDGFAGCSLFVGVINQILNNSPFQFYVFLNLPTQSNAIIFHSIISF